MRNICVLSMLAAALCAPAIAAPLGFRDIAGKGRGDVVEGAHCCVTGVVTLVSGWRGTSSTVPRPSPPPCAEA